MSIKLVVISTNSTEAELFYKLVNRGRWADIPYYYSVENHDWENGTVCFEMLCCSPSPRFKVGVAGNELVVSKNDYSEVSKWLLQWKIEFKKKEEHKFATPDAARSFLVQLRKVNMTLEDRKKFGAQVKRSLEEFYKNTEDELRLRNSRQFP